jgi:hypothetical protein
LSTILRIGIGLERRNSIAVEVTVAWNIRPGATITTEIGTAKSRRRWLLVESIVISLSAWTIALGLLNVAIAAIAAHRRIWSERGIRVARTAKIVKNRAFVTIVAEALCLTYRAAG